MTFENRITSLQQKHARIDESILAAQASPAADSTEISELKKRKLALKDELRRLSSH